MKYLFLFLVCWPCIILCQPISDFNTSSYKGKIEVREINTTGVTSLHWLNIESDSSYVYQSFEGKWEKFTNDSISILVDYEEHLIISLNYVQNKKQYKQMQFGSALDSLFLNYEPYDSTLFVKGDTGCLAYYYEQVLEVNNKHDNSTVRQYCLKSASQLLNFEKRKISDFIVFTSGVADPSKNYKGFTVIQQSM